LSGASAFLDRARAAAAGAPAAFALAAGIVLAYAAQRVMSGVEFRVGLPFDQPLQYALGLHPALLFSEGFFWQPLTHMFLHGSWPHVLCNALCLALLGRILEPWLGPGRLLILFFAGGILGGLVWAAHNGLWHLHADAPLGLCVGASGGVFGLLGACSAFYANRKLRVLVLFIPLRMKGKWLGALVLLFTAADAMLGLTRFAHAAHLAGFAAGWLLARRWRGEYVFEGGADAV